MTSLNKRYFWWTDGGNNVTYPKNKHNVTPPLTNGVYRYGDLDANGYDPALLLAANLTNKSAAGAALDLSER